MEKLDGYSLRPWLKFSLLVPALFTAITICAAPNSPADSLDESFDPTTLRDWKTLPNTIETIKPIEDELENRLMNASNAPQPPKMEVGYRVQVFSTSDYIRALRVDSLARIRWKQNVYLRFDSPYYKVRIGNARNRDDADQLQRDAIRAGYRNAWVVRTAIKHGENNN